MTRAEADTRCAELNDAPGAEPGVRWMAREISPGEWRAVRVRVPGLRATGPMTTSQESRPKPDAPPDPRPLVNPNWGPG